MLWREIKPGKRPGAPGAGGGGCHGWERSGQRPKEVWSEPCGWAESRTGQRWAHFEGRQEARAPGAEGQSARCRRWGAVGATRAHCTALQALVRVAAASAPKGRWELWRVLSKGGAQSGQHLRDWTARTRTNREPGPEPVPLIQGRHGGGGPG